MIPDLAALAEAERRLSATYDTLTDELAGGPSLLPGWTRAVLVRHVAVNARTNAQMVEAALRGEMRPQYAHAGEREELIDWGRGRAAAEVVADARLAAAEFAAVMERVTDWDQVVDAAVGASTVWQRARGREFEVEVHHADLDLGYGYADWPDTFVAKQLPHRVNKLPSRMTELHPGAWGIAVSGGGPSWTVLAAEPVVAVRDGLDDVRGLVTGPAWALLAWLLGRGDATALGLEVTGDPDVADLARWFPYG